ncbi:ubiquitin-conjugating enzyme E2 [candidate division CSSED10-310 bacterium]|uniref:Ubiquitin-conjugating enzyme E2 n=1 Tax=candidate division CSSED10-310 bacterium TaxID=2855610 RepID=A0ABV6YSU4_UNCC1
MSVRLRRLKGDYERMCTYFTGNSRIRVLKTIGNPPEKYQLEFLVTGLQQNLTTQQLKKHNSFIAEIVLTGMYPRLAPQCRLLTPVFHPNIAPHAICIGDHWAAGESLPWLMIRIAEMLAYQSYNIKSPLNGEAAKWTVQNQHRLPTDDFDFSALLTAGEVVAVNQDGSLKAGVECANCGKKDTSGAHHVCSNGHVTCENCLFHCSLCHSSLCLACSLETCNICHQTVCHNCIYKCSSCRRYACLSHSQVCHVCSNRLCDDCIVSCDRCREPTCINDINKINRDGIKVYLCATCVQANGSAFSSSTV